NKDMTNPIKVDVETSPFRLHLEKGGNIGFEKQYFWQVLPYDEFGNNFNKKSDMGYFKTPIRKAPDLISPIAEQIENLVTIRFNWEKVDWAAKYQLLIADNRDLKNAKVIDAFPPFNFDNSEGFIQLSKEYFWKVIPFDENDKNYNKSSVLGSFKTKPLPLIEVLQPVNQVIDNFTNIVFRWTPIEGAAGYQLVMSEEDPGLSSAKIFFGDTTALSVAGDSVPLEAGKKYYFKVFALDGSRRIMGPGSALYNFYTQKINAEKIVLLAPVGNTTEMNPKLKWTSITGADHYKIKINIEKLNINAEIDNIKETEKLLSDIIAVKPGEAYKWSVTAYDKDSKVFGEPSKEGLFILPIQQINLINPVGKKIPERTVKLQWDGFPFIDEYKVVLGTGPNLDNGKLFSVKENSLLLQDLIPGIYSWKVSGFKAGEEVVKPSVIAVFEIEDKGGKLAVIDPINKTVRGTKVTLKWSKGPDYVEIYKVKMGKDISLADAKEFSTKESQIEISRENYGVDLVTGNYSWQVFGLKDGKDIIKPSSVVNFRLEYQNEEVVGTGDQKSTGDVVEKPTYVEATLQDLQKFGDFVKDFLKVNGAGNILENYTYEEMDLDGAKDKINKVMLDDMIQGVIEIKSVKVR
ncbi:MAG: hypothetical protein PHV30_05750, partial [Candidatus Margulisbacteria bacterium]|nr:hypothetical protein [Candidatus Margulisiibacteriota bacterium]